ncbi:MAG: site-specific DNA-methyltransferase, partial [Clostridiales bacterium]|nr:site-specific DNA-methyltransferase [Clostridiales bacterium]
LSEIESKTVHLTWTSPPYNCLKRVGGYNNSEDNLSYKHYLIWLKDVFFEVYKVTVNGGRVVVNIDAITNREEDRTEEYIRPIYPNLYNFMRDIGWKFRTEICWLKSEAVGRKTAWGSYKSASNPTIRRNHEYLLVFSKGDWKLESDVESDITKKEFELYTLSTWNVMPETRKLKNHPAPFSEELSKRVIKLFSFPGQTVLDPFSGTGTTAYMAYMLGRDYIGIDNSEEYCQFARNRIEEGRQHKDMVDFFEPEKSKSERQKDIEEKRENLGPNIF